MNNYYLTNPSTHGSRKHVQKLDQLIEQVLKQSTVSWHVRVLGIPQMKQWDIKKKEKHIIKLPFLHAVVSVSLEQYKVFLCYCFIFMFSL